MRRPRVVVIVLVVLSIAVGASGVHAQTPSGSDGWVVLPVEDYRALRERAFPLPTPPPPPPMEAALTRVDYELRVDGDGLSGRALLAIDVLRDGWARVQIPAGLMVRDATVDGRRVSIVGGAQPHVLLSRAGRSVLTLDVVVPLAAGGGAESIVLPPSPSPISRARLTLPRSGVDLTLEGGFIADHVEAPTESSWTLIGRPNVPLAMTWKRKVDDRRAEQPLRVRARITQLVGLSDDACQVSASVRVDVVQGATRELTLAIPANLVVNQVNGSTVADWSAANGTLRVTLLEPTSSDASFVVQGDAKTPREGAVPVPLVRMPSAERETGGVAVDIVGAGEVGAQQARGVERADPSELGDILANRDSPSMIAFRHRPIGGSEPRSLTVDVVRYTPQAVVVANVEEARYRALASGDGHVLVEGRLAVRNNQRSFLKATLPAGATLWSAEVAGRPIQPGLSSDGAVLLPLEKGRAGEQAPTFVVELVYVQRVEAWTDKSRPHLELPALDLPVSRTGLELRYSPRFRVEPIAGAFRVDHDPGPSAEALRVPRTALHVAVESRDEKAAAGLQALVDRFRDEVGGKRVAGTLPVHVEFPEFGAYVFLASELTAETTTPAIDLMVRRINN